MLIADHLQAVCAFLEGKHALDARNQLMQYPGRYNMISVMLWSGARKARAGNYRRWRAQPFLIGPPGTGKTMLASRINGLFQI